ncbi:MAG: succinate dehydrogenase/fumarate reductase iron-sulfur subunit [Oligoflexia bacterium]|nr:succinate dehydrogenase/fumarate reductase iron-sulfur subunit [Oligoflexia bacterium]
MKIHLKIWRQKGPSVSGGFENYTMENVLGDMSFLEMLDELNVKLVKEGKEPVAFESDCREGICGSCSLVIDGNPHGPEKATTACQLFMRHYRDGDTITVEPFRAKAFPLQKDLIVDRSSFDRIQQAGGYCSVRVGSAVDANVNLINKENADRAFDAATCIGCGACVAVCKNASAMLFVSAKVAQFALLPQGQPERDLRARNMVAQMDAEGFGNCTNTKACEATCPKEIKVENIRMLNREYARAKIVERPLNAKAQDS